MSDKNWRDIAKKTLLNAYNTSVRDYATYNWGRNRIEDAVSIVVLQDIAYQYLEYIRLWLPKNLKAFVGTTRWYDEKEKHPENSVEVVIAPAETQFDILRIAHTENVNDDLTTAEIIERLEKYHAAYGIDIYHAANDSVLFRLKQIPDDMEAFVQDIGEFCNDTLTQIHGTPELFKQQVEISHLVYLWWD